MWLSVSVELVGVYDTHNLSLYIHTPEDLSSMYRYTAEDLSSMYKYTAVNPYSRCAWGGRGGDVHSVICITPQKNLPKITGFHYPQ